MGKLILLTTPLGNLADLSERARATLENQEVLAAEDTRTLKALLSALGISSEGKTLLSYHDHSSQRQSDAIFSRLERGDVVLTSDAGSPYLSDPAMPLVKGCYERGIEVDTLPGPSAPIAALELSGLPPVPFHFHGFGPRKSSQLRSYIEEHAQQKGTHLFFEGKSRVEQSLKIMREVFPGTVLVLVREISKKHQEVLHFEGEIPALDLKGEFVLLYHLEQTRSGADTSELTECLSQERPRKKELAKILAKLSGVNSKDIYALLNS